MAAVRVRHAIRPIVEEARINQIWVLASQHRHGEGSEHGLDWSVSQKHYNWYIKNIQIADAGALMAIFTRAPWPGQRIAQEDTES
eukprot:7435629-Karenia_brevis.AAC.1